MIKCDCYKTLKKLCYSPFCNQSYYQTVGICYGTKEREECHCDGYKTKCDFYPEVRDKAQFELEYKRVETNADYIRKMNDKELAEFLMSEWFGDRICFYCEGEYEKCGDFKYCESKILEWLSKEKR